MSAIFKLTIDKAANSSTKHLATVIFDRYYIYGIFRLWIYNFKNWVEEEISYGLGFSLLTLCAGIGALSYFCFPFTLEFLDIFAALGLAGCGLRYRRLRLILYPILAFFIGALCASFEDWRYDAKMLHGSLSGTLVGKLVELPKQKAKRYHLIVSLEKMNNIPAKFLPRRVRLSARAIAANLHIGDIINGYAKLYSVGGPSRVGGYDFSFYNYFNSIGARGYFLGKVNYIGSDNNLSWRQIIYNKIQNIRNAINNRIAIYQNNEEGSIAAALITGARSGISEQTSNMLRQAGLAHILAISGLHMSIVTGLVFLSIRYFCSFFVKFGSYFCSKKIAAFFALISAACYFALSGGSPSAQRSFVMVEIIFLAILFDKQAITLRNLLLAVWVTIIIYPHQLLDPSFQMSFAAAAALIAIYKNLHVGFNKYPEGLLKPNRIWRGVLYLGSLLLNTALASLIAGSASSIFAMYNFSNFAPYAVVSNVLAAGLISFLIMPLALISVLAMIFHLEAKPLYLLAKSIVLLKKISFFVANITPNIPIKFMHSYILAILAFGFCLLVIMRTKLRLIGVIIIIFGFIAYYKEAFPIGLIAEDGKMFLALDEDHKAHLCSQKYTNFILKDWQKAYLFKDIDKKCPINFYIVNSSQELEQVLKNNIKPKIIYLNYYDLLYKDLYDKNIIFIPKQKLQLHGMVEIYNNYTKWAVPNVNRSWTYYRTYEVEGFR